MNCGYSGPACSLGDSLKMIMGHSLELFPASLARQIGAEKAFMSLRHLIGWLQASAAPAGPHTEAWQTPGCFTGLRCPTGDPRLAR